MTSDPVAEARLSSRKSLPLLFILLAVALSVAFFGALGVMLVLPQLLSADTSEWARALRDVGLLAALLTVAMLPLMLHLRLRKGGLGPKSTLEENQADLRYETREIGNSHSSTYFTAAHSPRS